MNDSYTLAQPDTSLSQCVTRDRPTITRTQSYGHSGIWKAVGVSPPPALLFAAGSTRPVLADQTRLLRPCVRRCGQSWQGQFFLGKFYTDSAEKVWEGCGKMGKRLEGPKSHDTAPHRGTVATGRQV